VVINNRPVDGGPFLEGSSFGQVVISGTTVATAYDYADRVLCRA